MATPRGPRWLSCSQPRGLLVALSLCLQVSSGAFVSPAHARDPVLAPGSDPGGVAFAVVGSGLAHGRSGGPDLLARLARDGEGEAIAWDFADDDPRPFAAPGEAGDEALAALILREGGATRLVVVRAPADRAPALAPALRFVAETPARIALLLPRLREPIPFAPLADAARRLPGLLLVVPARLAGPGSEPEPAGLLRVAASGGAAASVPGSADVAVPAEASPGPGATASAAGGAHPDDVAAARVTALAARLLAREPRLAGAALKARILAYARPQTGGVPLLAAIERVPGPP